MLLTLRYLCLATAVLCIELQPRPQSFEELKGRFHFRRAVDGSRGRKYFDPDEDGSYDRYRHLEDHYDGSNVKSGFEDIRGNVPGEPGADYPVYTRVPKTRFSCENRAQGYYADEEAGCQAFHVCSNVVVSSFICPVGSIFSQKLLTCDWWNKVDCAMTESYYTMRQGSFRDTNEMIRKAFTMMQLPKPDITKSDPRIEASSPPKRVNIGFRGNERTKFDVRGAFGTLRDRNVGKYNHLNSKQTGVFENFGFGGNGAGAVNENAPPTQNVVNVNYLRPENYESNLEGFGSRLNNDHAKDSSIVYIQRNPNDNVRESYSTPRPFTFGNSFQGSRQFQQNDFRNSFQPSYAPTVPTVTSTTRRLYSPTVPTTPRPSTVSYDQDPEVYLLQQEANRQSDQDYGTAAYTDNGQYRENIAEIIQPQESIGIVQSYGERLIKSESNNPASFEPNPRNTGAQFGTGSNVPGYQEGYRHFYIDQVTVDSRLRRQETGGVGGVSVENQTNVSDSQQNIPPLIVQIPRPEGEPGKPVTDIGDQLFTYDSFIKMSPVMPETPPPVGSSTPDSEGVSIRITPLIPETAPPPVSDDEDVFPPPRKRPPMISDIPQSIGTLGLNLSGVADETFESPQTTQPPATSEESSFSVMDENPTTVPPRTTPVISQIPGSVGASGVNIPDGNFTLSSLTPPLILQPSQNDTRSASQPSSTVGDESTFDASSGLIPPLISDVARPDETQGSIPTDSMQTDENGATVPPRTTPIISQIPGSVGASGVNISDIIPDRSFTSESPLMPPLIVQSPQNATPPDPQPSSMVDDTSSFDTPPRIIPPLISGVAQPNATQSPILTDDPDSIQSFESSSRIPPLIPQTSRPPLPPFSDTSTRIPLLIPSIPQSTDTQTISPPNGDDGTNTLEPPSRVPPLLPPTPRPLPPSFSGTIDDGDTSTRIPLLIPPIPQSTDTPAISPPVGNDGTNTFESSSRVPPLIPPPSRPPPPSLSDTINDGDTSTRIPLLIPPIPQSTDAPAIRPPVGNDGRDTLESSSRIPPLISQTSTPPTPPFQPIDSLAINSPDQTYPFELPSRIPPLLPPTPRPPQPSESLGPINDDEVRIPPLIPQIPQSTDMPATERPDIDADRTYPFEPPSRIPPLIPQIAQPSTPLATVNGGNTRTEIPPLIPETPSFGANDEKKTLDLSPSVQQVPPLISQMSGTLDIPDSSYPFESPLSIPPLIPQTSRPVVSSGSSRPPIPEIPQSPPKPTQTFVSSTNPPPLIVQTMVDDGDISSIIPKIDAVIPLIPESSGTKSPSQNVGGTHGPPTIAPVIPQILEYIGRPGVKPTNIFYQSKTSYDSRPPPTLGTSFDSGNPSNSWVSSTTEQTFFSYTGPYQPLPSGNFPTSTMRQPPDQSYPVVTSPTVNIPANVPESSTISPTPHVGNPGYGIDVPDCRPTGPCYSSTPKTVTSRYDHSSDVGSLESIVEPARGQISKGISYFPIDDSQQSSLTHNIAVSLLPPKIDSRYINSIRNVNVARQNLTNEETSTLASPDKYNNLFEQSSITPSPYGSELPSQQGSEDDLRFTIRGGFGHTTPTPFPPFSGISSTLRTQSSTEPRQNVFISDDSNADSAPPKLYYPENVAENNNQESSTISSNEGTNVAPTEPTFERINYSQGPFESSSTPNPSSTASVTESRVSPDPLRDSYLQSTIGSSGLPPGFPAGFSQIEASLNNDNSPYQVTITLDGDEDFNPTADFISKLFAQHNGDGQLGFGDLAGYEIVRSEDSAADDMKPATLDIAPSQAPTLSTLLDSRVNLGGPESAQQYYIADQNPGTSSTTTRETRPPKMESLKSNNSFFGDGPDAAVQQRLNLESFDLPTKNATQWASDLRHEELRNRANLSIQKAKDINSSFESLFESVPKKAESPPLVKEHILEQLTKSFGHPLFNYGGSQINSIRPEDSRSIDYADKQQFADLKKYRVPKKQVVKESQESTSPASPETSTTTSTTSESPVRTFVETEFLPALSFSFDSDTGRQEYVEAVLKGLLSDDQPVDPWADSAASYRDSRENEKSENSTTEMQKA